MVFKIKRKWKENQKERNSSDIDRIGDFRKNTTH
jgi:hypothetical protein